MRERRVIHPMLTQHEDYTTDFNGSSPHRAGHSNGIHPEDRPRLTDEQKRPPQQQTRRPVQYQYDDGTEDEALYDMRSPSSARRYQQQMPVMQAPRTVVRYHRQQIPPRSSRTQQYPPLGPQQHQQAPSHTTEPQAKRPQTRRREWHWLVYVGLTCIAVLAVFVGGSLAVRWWHGFQDDVHYGRPRTSQYDVRIGHSDDHTRSHFLAVNLNKQIEIIEFPGGDVTKARVYVGPTLVGDGEDLTPVTLEFRDVNGDGKPDMILHIGESRTVFINENGQFRLAKPSDNITL